MSSFALTENISSLYRFHLELNLCSLKHLSHTAVSSE